MQLFQSVETAVVTEGFLLMMTILGYYLISGQVAGMEDTRPLDVFVIIMAVLLSIPPLWILRYYLGKMT
ncbi:hypothetical protein [Methanorbis rubei]|uniref:Uncharacterized protein n=1 Tax=Methanorbis rubei TaxID=3028300 RepID=A0AAE4SC50_9EURY|nr:hypothetical protein [Methanocorpusculaceae archaeon Cs1]